MPQSAGKMNRFHTMLLVLGGSFALALAQAEYGDPDLQDLLSLVDNLAALGNTELNVISDFTLPGQSRLLASLNQAGIPVFVYDLDSLLQAQERDFSDEPCPIFGAPSYENSTVAMGEERIHIRTHVMPTHRHHRSIFVWTSDSKKLLEAVEVFDKSVLWCEQRKEPGLYNAGTRFYFYVNSNESAVSDVLSAGDMKKHARAAAIQRLPDGKFAFWGFDFFSEYHKPPPVLNYIWSKENVATDSSSLFTSMSDFAGRTFDVHVMPWAHYVLADFVEDADGGTDEQRYRNYWGYELEMLWALQETLNFKYTMTNPADGLWGLISEEGTWNGMVAEAAVGKAEIIMSDILTSFNRYQVIQPTIFYNRDFLCFSSPPPAQKAKWLALVYPFDEFIWALIAGSLFAVAVVFWGVANAEGTILKGPKLLPWADLREATWYSFGTLLGESITRDTRSERSTGLRCVIGAWIVYTVIIGASYGGNLKAFLTTPSYSEPITTLQGILDSDLPWNMIIYGEEEEGKMEKSTDPVIKAIWDGKTVIEYNPTPQLHTVFAGDAVLVDWQSGMQGAIYVKYSTPDGTPLVYIAREPVFYANWVGLGFHKLNPWVGRFDQVISRMLEGGLIVQWEKRVWARMRAEARASGEEEIELNERADLSPLTMDDTQGLFYLAALALGVGALGFAAEKVAQRCTGRSRKNNIRDDIEVPYYHSHIYGK